ncbi:hypothetical protein BH11VER1_BH11VER1_11090 [soil metagenome]
MSSDIQMTGWGSVSPAGWSVLDLYDAVRKNEPLPVTTACRFEGAMKRNFRKVPALSVVPDYMKHARLRRSAPATRFAIHAAVEALGPEKFALAQSGALSLGVIFCTMSGCVQFSRRFYAEVLENPMLASPILFPETVYNAPSSHLSALLASTEINYTLVGDSAQFVRGIEIAHQWMEDDLVQACLVVAAEELDWVSDEAWMLFHRQGAAAEGAAAVLLERREGLNIKHFTGTQTYGNRVSRQEAVQRVKAELLAHSSSQAALCDGLGAGRNADCAEAAAWLDWQGGRCSVRPILGEGFGITSGWQTVMACELLHRGEAPEAIVNAIGLSQQAVGMVVGTKGLRFKV